MNLWTRELVDSWAHRKNLTFIITAHSLCSWQGTSLGTCSEGCTAGCTDHMGHCKVGRFGVDSTGLGPGRGQAVVWAAGCCMPWTGYSRGRTAVCTACRIGTGQGRRQVARSVQCKTAGRTAGSAEAGRNREQVADCAWPGQNRRQVAGSVQCKTAGRNADWSGAGQSLLVGANPLLGLV